MMIGLGGSALLGRVCVPAAAVAPSAPPVASIYGAALGGTSITAVTQGAPSLCRFLEAAWAKPLISVCVSVCQASMAFATPCVVWTTTDSVDTSIADCTTGWTGDSAASGSCCGS